MEDSYKASLLKSFRKQLDNLYFRFIIVDTALDKAKHIEEFWGYAKSKGFQVYVAEVTAEAAVCHKRNTHNRSLQDIQKVIAGWEATPTYCTKLDIRSLLQDDAIEEVRTPMEKYQNNIILTLCALIRSTGCQYAVSLMLIVVLGILEQLFYLLQCVRL